MSRIPKYQAWHKHLKEMFEVAAIQFREPSFVVKKSVSGVNLETWTLDEVELREFTGLTDRLGKEIYEGDIIKCYDGITESYFNSVVEWQIRELTHEVATVPLEVSGFIIGSLSEVEVIGNIYENHELL